MVAPSWGKTRSYTLGPYSDDMCCADSFAMEDGCSMTCCWSETGAAQILRAELHDLDI
jgi:hypothetical protein